MIFEYATLSWRGREGLSRREIRLRPSGGYFPRSIIAVYRARSAVRLRVSYSRAHYCTYFPAAAAEHGCCAAAAASRRRELRLMTDVAESCAPFPLQLHHAHLQLPLLPLPLSLTDTDSTTVLDAHVFSPLHEFGASCPLPEIVDRVKIYESTGKFSLKEGKKIRSFLLYFIIKIKISFTIWFFFFSRTVTAAQTMQ